MPRAPAPKGSRLPLYRSLPAGVIACTCIASLCAVSAWTMGCACCGTSIALSPGTVSKLPSSSSCRFPPTPRSMRRPNPAGDSALSRATSTKKARDDRLVTAQNMKEHIPFDTIDRPRAPAAGIFPPPFPCQVSRRNDLHIRCEPTLILRRQLLRHAVAGCSLVHYACLYLLSLHSS